MAGILRQAVVLLVIGGVGYGGYEAFRHYAVATEDTGASRRGNSATVVEVAIAEESLIERSVSAIGSGTPVRAVELKMLTSGRVEAVAFRGGETVEAGTVLVRLRDEDARAALAEAQADLVEARSAYERAQTLRQQGRVAEASAEAALAALARSEARLQRAQTDMENRELIAPFDGVIGFPGVELGTSVGSDTVIAALDDLSRLSVEFRVPERFFGEVREGATLRAESSIFPDEVFEGEITAVGRRLDVVSRTFEVRGIIDNADLRLPGGAFLRVELVFDDRTGVTVPEEAVVSQGDGHHVFVVGEDDRAQRREIRLGIRRVGTVEVLDGIEAGERVITRGIQRVRDGAPVRLQGGAPEGGAPRSS